MGKAMVANIFPSPHRVINVWHRSEHMIEDWPSIFFSGCLKSEGKEGKREKDQSLSRQMYQMKILRTGKGHNIHPMNTKAEKTGGEDGTDAQRKEQ